jgi:hypothetical protein
MQVESMDLVNVREGALRDMALLSVTLKKVESDEEPLLLAKVMVSLVEVKSGSIVKTIHEYVA